MCYEAQFPLLTHSICFQVTVLLLYHTSISTKSPKDWNEFEYKIQVTPNSSLQACCMTLYPATDPAVGVEGRSVIVYRGVK